MNKNQKGFSIIEVVLVLLLLGLLVGIGWYAWDKIGGRSSSERPPLGHKDTLTIPSDREYTLYLDGATDDSLVNYYKIGLDIKLDNSNSNIIDPGFGPGPYPCPQIAEEYGIDERYDDSTLIIKIVDYQRVENPKGLDENDPQCKKIRNKTFRGPSNKKVFDIDKSWLIKKSYKNIRIEGLDNEQLQLDTSEQKLTLKKSNDIISQIPFYPDKVAVMIAWGDDCPANSQTLVRAHAESSGLDLADDKHPGLSLVYRRPKREVHVMLNSLRDTEGRKYPKDLGGDCSIITSKPNLKDWRRKGLPYQD